MKSVILATTLSLLFSGLAFGDSKPLSKAEKQELLKLLQTLTPHKKTPPDSDEIGLTVHIAADDSLSIEGKAITMEALKKTFPSMTVKKTARIQIKAALQASTDTFVGLVDFFRESGHKPNNIFLTFHE